MLKKIGLATILFISAYSFSYNKNLNYNTILEKTRVDRVAQLSKEIKDLYNYASIYIMETGDIEVSLKKITKYFKLNEDNFKNYLKDGYLDIRFNPDKERIEINDLISKNPIDMDNVENVYIAESIKKNIEYLLTDVENILLLSNGENYTLLIPENKNLKIFNLLKAFYSSYPECEKATFKISFNPSTDSGKTICKINEDGTVDVYIRGEFQKRLYMPNNFTGLNSDFIISTFKNIANNETADGKKILNLVPGTIVLIYDDTKPVNERKLIPVIYTEDKTWKVIDFKIALLDKANLLINATNKPNEINTILKYDDTGIVSSNQNQEYNSSDSSISTNSSTNDVTNNTNLSINDTNNTIINSSTTSTDSIANTDSATNTDSIASTDNTILDSNNSNENLETVTNNTNDEPEKYGAYTYYPVKELDIGENIDLAKEVFQGSINFGPNYVVNSYGEGGDQYDKNPGIEIPLKDLKVGEYIRLKLKLNSYSDYYKDYFAIFDKDGNKLKSFYTYGAGANDGVLTPKETIFYMYIPVLSDTQRIHISEAWSRYIYVYGFKVVDEAPSSTTTDGITNVIIK